MPATILQLVGLTLIVVAAFFIATDVGFMALGAVAVYVGLAVERE